jgi:hypothetical protein
MAEDGETEDFLKLGRLAVCLIVSGSGLILPMSSSAVADGPMITWLPDAACNQGTANAQMSNPNPFNPHIPHSHPGTDCMTMPGTKAP